MTEINQNILNFNVYTSIVNGKTFNRKGEEIKNFVKLDINSILVNIYNFKAANPAKRIKLNAMVGNFDMLAKIAKQIGISDSLVMEKIKYEDGREFCNLMCELPKELPDLQNITRNRYKVFDSE